MGKRFLQERHNLVDGFIASVPPPDFQQLLNDGPREAFFKWLCWIPSHDCVGLYVFDDYRVGCEDAARSNMQATHDRASLSDPHVILDDNVSLCGWVTSAIDLAVGEYVVDDVSKGKGCRPIGSVISAKENRDVAGDGAKAAYVQVCAFAPAAYFDIFKAV